MENQHRKIHGYRELTQAEIDLMNEIKALGTTIEPLMKKIRVHITRQRVQAERDTSSEDIALVAKGKQDQQRFLEADPYKWLNLARDGMQLSLMQATRAVAQPTFF